MYKRELSKKEKLSLNKKYQKYFKKTGGGFITTNRKLRLFGLKKSSEGTPDADFWLKLKESARGSIVGLQLISDLGHTDQLKEIFGPIHITKNLKNDLSDPSNQISLSSLIETILSTKHEKNEDDLWKSLLAKDIMEKCFDYIKENKILMTKSHLNLIEQMQDLINAIVSVSVQVPVENRESVKF